MHLNVLHCVVVVVVVVGDVRGYSDRKDSTGFAMAAL